MWTVYYTDGSSKRLTDTELSNLKDIPDNFVGSYLEEIKINTFKGDIVIRRDKTWEVLQINA